jgi:hypothetical protein
METLTPQRFPCPCCGYLTLSLPQGGSYLLCPVCYWEDDQVQFDDPNYTGGANEESLNMARDNFKKIGASSRRALTFVRAPLANEQPEPK